MKFKRILLTGGAGFIGSHLCQLLLSEGQKVRILDLPHVTVDHLPINQIELYRGDVTQQDDCLTATRDCDLIIHLAGNPNLWAAEPDAFDAVNHQGTRHMLQAAHYHQAEKFLYISTESILISKQTTTMINEHTETQLEDMVGAYCRSKWRAEAAAREAQAQGQNVTILNPTIPIGPHDPHLGPLSRVIRDFCKGQIKAYMNGTINVIDVNDVAKGIWNAAQASSSSQRYLLGHENWTILELFEKLAKLTGQTVPQYRVPYPVALGFAWLEELICPWVTQRPPMATTTGIKLSHLSKPFDASHTIKNLNLDLTPCEQTLQEMVQWMTAEKII